MLQRPLNQPPDQLSDKVGGLNTCTHTYMQYANHKFPGEARPSA